MASISTQTSRPNGDITRFRFLISTMARHPEICLIIFSVSISVLTKIGVSFHTKQILEPAGSPGRFFPIGSPVIDFTHGDLAPIADAMHKEELIFVMYYAPWCAKSIQIRNEFQKAARALQHKVRFVGVNCWWSMGACRSQYKFLMFPELFLYHTYIGGYRYTGVMTADYMVRFIEDMMYPVTFLHTQDEVKQFIARHDTSVVGYFDFNASPQPPGYTQFYYAAMRLIEYDHIQHVKFAAVSQSGLARSFTLEVPDSLVLLRRYNYTMTYPQTDNFTCSAIQRWVILNQDKPVVKFLSPPGHKNLLISSEIAKGPAMFVFVPENKLLLVSYYYNLVRELALHYSHCEDSNNTLEDLVKVSAQDRQQMVLDHQEQQLSCQPNSTLFSLDKICCVSIATSHNHQKVCEYCKHIHSSKSSPCIVTSSSDIAQELTFGGVQTPTCIESVQNYNVNEHRSLCCKHCNFDSLKHQECSSRRATDLFVVNNQHIYRNNICRKLTLQKLQRLPLPHQYVNSKDISYTDIPVNFTGLKCTTNRTLNFFVLDKLHHGIYADRLSQGLSDTQTSSVIIIDKLNEAHYILREEFSLRNLANFIMNYTSNNIQRHLRSEIKATVCDDLKGDNICITDVTSASFQETVMDESRDVVLFVYAPWCGFCASIAHLYISLAKYFKTAKHIIFTRINADANDLPWEFTIDRYPTILFFPANRKAESVVFPETVPKTLPNLIKFVMNHATHDLRTDTIVDVCSKTCKKNNLENSIYLIHTLRRKVMVIRQRIKYLSQSLPNQKKNQQEEEFVELKWSKRKDAIEILTSRLRKLELQLSHAMLLRQYLRKHYKDYINKEDFTRFLNQHKQSPDVTVKHKLHYEL